MRRKQGFDVDPIRLSDDTSHTIGESHLFLPKEAVLAALGGLGAPLVDGLDPAFTPLLIVRAEVFHENHRSPTRGCALHSRQRLLRMHRLHAASKLGAG